MANQPYSPLDEVFETEHYPHARTLRTSFTQKMWDSYHAFAGTSPLLADEPHIGIFDYATLFIPLGLYILMLKSFEDYDKSLKGLILPLSLIIINIPFIITRIVCAAIATLIATPITAIVHLFSFFIAKKERQTALNVSGLSMTGENITLSDYLMKNHLTPEQIKADIVWDQRHGAPATPETYQLQFWPKQSNIEIALWCEKVQAGNPPFSITIDPQKPSTNIHALFALNIGRATSLIEHKLAVEEDAYHTDYQHLRTLLT